MANGYIPIFRPTEREERRPARAPVERVRPQFPAMGKPQPLPRQRTTSERRIDMLIEAGLGILAGGAQAGIRYGTEKALIGEREKAETGLIGKRGAVEEGLIKKRGEVETGHIKHRAEERRESDKKQILWRNKALRSQMREQYKIDEDMAWVKHGYAMDEIAARAKEQNKNNQRAHSRSVSAARRLEKAKRGRQIVVTMPSTEEGVPGEKRMIPLHEYNQHIADLRAGISTMGGEKQGLVMFGASAHDALGQLLAMKANGTQYKSEKEAMKAHEGVQRGTAGGASGWTPPKDWIEDKKQIFAPVVPQPKRPSGDSAAVKNAETDKKDKDNAAKRTDRAVSAAEKELANVKGGDVKGKKAAQEKVKKAKEAAESARSAAADATEALKASRVTQEEAMAVFHSAGAPAVDEESDAMTKYQAAVETYNGMTNEVEKMNFKTRTLRRLADAAGVKMADLPE